MKKRTYRFEIRLTKSQADFGFGPGILLRKDVEYDNQPDMIGQEFLDRIHKDSFKVLGEVIEFDAKKVVEVEASGTSQCGCGGSSRCSGNHPKLAGATAGSKVTDLGNGMAMVEVPHQPVVPPRHCEPCVQSVYQQVLPREIKSDTQKFVWPTFSVTPGRKVTALISVEELVAKVRDAIRENSVLSDVAEADCTEQVTKDLTKVDFDRENVQTNADNRDVPHTRTLPNGLTIMPVQAGGDWETPVAFVLYWDGAKIRGYVPANGNHFNRTTKKAYGNDEALDEADMVKVYGCNIFDAGEQGHNWAAIFDEVQVRISTEGANPVDPNVVLKKPGNGHLVSVSKYKHDSWGTGDYLFTVWETSRKYFETHNCLDDHSSDEVVPALLKSIGLSCDCEATWSVDDEHKEKYKTRQQLIVALTALGFETDPAFDDLCQGDEKKEDDDSESEEDEDEDTDDYGITDKPANPDRPGEGWLYAMVDALSSDKGYMVYITPAAYFQKNHTIDSEYAPQYIADALLELAMEEQDVNFFENTGILDREQNVEELEKLGFVNDPAFQEFCEKGCDSSVPAPVTGNPGEGWLFAIGKTPENEAGFIVTTTPKHFWEARHCMDDTSPDMAMKDVLRTVSLYECMESTFEPDGTLTMEDTKARLEAMGFVNDPAFQKFCVAGMSEYFAQEPEELEDDEDDADGMEQQLERVLDDFLPGRNWLAAVSQEKSFGVWKVWVTSREYFAKKHFMDDRCAPPWMQKLMKEIGMHHACDMIFTVSWQNSNLYATREELIAALESKGFANDVEFQKYGDEHGC